MSEFKKVLKMLSEASEPRSTLPRLNLRKFADDIEISGPRHGVKTYSGWAKDKENDVLSYLNSINGTVDKKSWDFKDESRIEFHGHFIKVFMPGAGM